jgi:hypothetical protein
VGGCLGSGGGDGAARGQPRHPLMHVRDLARQRALARSRAAQPHSVRAAVMSVRINVR